MVIHLKSTLAIASFVTVVAGQATTPSMPLAGGGEVSIRQDGEFLHVSVKGPRVGLASLCVGDESRVRILHASAAVAEATYEKNGEEWILKSKFDFKLRDARTGPPSEEDQRQFLASNGWIANASNAGNVDREFRIRVSDRLQFLGVTFFTTTEPMAISHWPPTLDDDCRAVKVAQGFLPPSAQFRPSEWHRLK